MFNEDNADHRWDQSDPFGEDFYLVPHAEEVWARNEQLAAENQDYFRHFVELAIWGALDNPDLLKVLLSLFWLWEDVDPRWLAEASSRSVGDVRDLVDSEPIKTFKCLYCRVELRAMHRDHQMRTDHSHKTYRRDGGDPPTNIVEMEATPRLISSARRALHRGPLTPKINVAWTIFASRPSLPTIAAGPMRSEGKRRSGRSSRNRYIVETAIAAAYVGAMIFSYTFIIGRMKRTQRKGSRT